MLKFTPKAFAGAEHWSRQRSRMPTVPGWMRSSTVGRESADTPGSLAEIRLESLDPAAKAYSADEVRKERSLYGTGVSN